MRRSVGRSGDGSVVRSVGPSRLGGSAVRRFGRTDGSVVRAIEKPVGRFGGRAGERAVGRSRGRALGRAVGRAVRGSVGQSVRWAVGPAGAWACALFADGVLGEAEDGSTRQATRTLSNSCSPHASESTPGVVEQPESHRGAVEQAICAACNDVMAWDRTRAVDPLANRRDTIAIAQGFIKLDRMLLAPLTPVILGHIGAAVAFAQPQLFEWREWLSSTISAMVYQRYESTWDSRIARSRHSQMDG